MFRLAALGAVGYAAYRYYQKNNASSTRASTPRLNAVAGGPLSSQATLEHDSDRRPV